MTEAIQLPFHTGELTFDIEASIGVAISPDHAVTGDELVQRADVAMYVAKTSHSGWRCIRPSADRHSPEKLVLLGQLRRAIEEDELVLHYQPKNGLPDEGLRGVEALVRWNHPERGMIPPDEFIPLAEHTSLMDPLTSWVLREATAQVRRWLDAGIRLPVAVNISARSLMDASFADHVREIVELAGIPAELVELEVTETAIMREPERARQVMSALAAFGISLAIDDFGIGYTSLAYLRTLPVHTLKIDRSFVKNMHIDSSDAVIVRSVIELGRNLGLEVVAEGVEDAETCADLGVAGCSMGQGFYWSRPVAVAELDRWIAVQSAAGRMGNALVSPPR